MILNSQTTILPGVIMFEPPVFGDARGFLQQTWHQRQYAELGLSV
ncbi:MAG: dTDP-4-dehydrorhamnose 3,5-epimerase family protein, partial [Sedimentisphaerales bacterium]|nr:dTDP-4-dehydrorhamnose 3,5-epimerase family protein [Sedimentisphaerales bacterium]